MKTHLEVRFHLQSGKNFRKWQVKIMEGRKKVSVRYYDPQEVQLEMRGCRLANNLKKAIKVHKAQKKDVSGAVHCEEVVLTRVPTEGLERLFYNPIRDVHWRREGDAGEFAWDETSYSTLVTQGWQVYILEERI
jgi:hypothetical protein